MILRKNPLNYTNGKYFSIPDEQIVPWQILPRHVKQGVTWYGRLCPEWLTLRMKLAGIPDDTKQNSGHTQTRVVNLSFIHLVQLYHLMLAILSLGF